MKSLCGSEQGGLQMLRDQTGPGRLKLRGSVFSPRKGIQWLNEGYSSMLTYGTQKQRS